VDVDDLCGTGSGKRRHYVGRRKRQDGAPLTWCGMLAFQYMRLRVEDAPICRRCEAKRNQTINVARVRAAGGHAEPAWMRNV
jgi:hypothetical protein